MREFKDLSLIEIGEVKPGEIILVNGIRWGHLEGFSRYLISETGLVYTFIYNRVIKNSKNAHGYLSNRLLKDGSKGKSFLNHRLLGMLFIPNPDNKPFINHINGVKNDNRLNNLEWVTAKENVSHAFRIGLHKNHTKGERQRQATLSDKIVSELKAILLDPEFQHVSLVDLGKVYNTTNSILTAIKNNNSWKGIEPSMDKSLVTAAKDRVRKLIKENKIRIDIRVKTPRIILQIDSEGRVVDKFNNAREIGKIKGWPYSAIYNVIDKSNRTAYGFKWVYVNG